VVTVADPDSFEAKILVSEMDILQITAGSTAWVAVDALSGLSLPAEVAHISPTATIQSGVVNYEVTVEVKSLEVMAMERQQAMPDFSSEEMAERLKQAVESGMITQEQADQILEQMQQGQLGQRVQSPAVIPEDYQLREGLTVTVTVIVAESSDALLVPNTAITTQGRQTTVQVVLPDGTIEERVVQTGISNWQYTEVTSGLSEGEDIMVPEGTTTASTTTQQGPGGMMPFPGMGRP
jgi:macrolide-specific efflux system membrane fusion protein